MIYPRLFFARNFLREDGVIFVSIDDREIHNLRFALDEIFGEENLIANHASDSSIFRSRRRARETEVGRKSRRARQTIACAGRARRLHGANATPPSGDRSRIVGAVHCADGRALVTLDLDFANPVVFPPLQHAGVAVLRLPRKATANDLTAAVGTLVVALRTQTLSAALWVVEPGRVRVYSPES